MRLLSSIARAPLSRFASSMSRWVSNLFVARAFHSSTSENDVVTYGEDNVTSFMSFSALLLAQRQPDVFLTINYSKKTIPSLSAYYFHLVTLMFQVTVNVSVILNVKLQKNCICIHSLHQLFKIMFYLFLVELLQGAHNFKIYPFLIFFGLLYTWNVLHCSVHM